MAIFIGAIALLGSGDIEVGPSMLRDNLDITWKRGVPCSLIGRYVTPYGRCTPHIYPC